ncbi:MAG: YabP/YqfC family sporulation protein [Firmicutes bacterium]|nr:YabP/YqfC family sporulation protein [Bacillota bacterium]
MFFLAGILNFKSILSKSAFKYNVIMGFLENIANFCGLPLDTVLTSFKIIMLSDKSVYIEGSLKITSYSQTEISLKVKGGYLLVTGENLTVKEYCKSDLVICGHIKSVTVL